MSTAAANPWPQQTGYLELDDADPVIAEIERVERILHELLEAAKNGTAAATASTPKS